VTPPPPPPELAPPPEPERTGWTGGRIGGSEPDETDPSPEPEVDDVEPVEPPLADVDFELDVCEDDFAATPNTTAVAATEAASTQRVVPESRLRPSSDRARGFGTDSSEGGSRPTGPGGGRAGRAEHVRHHPSSVEPTPVSGG
jgi:hypothetical protein